MSEYSHPQHTALSLNVLAIKMLTFLHELFLLVCVGFDGALNTGLTLRTIRVMDGIGEVRAGATLLHDRYLMMWHPILLYLPYLAHAVCD